MGAADVVPGVSGGTMAFILGIYARLITSIRSFDLLCLQQVCKFEFKSALQRPDFKFLIPLLIGILSAIVFFTRIIPLPTLLHTHPELIYGLFFGLIIGSIVVLLAEIKKFNWHKFLFLIIGATFGWFIVNLVPVNTPDHIGFIFLSGMLAISAMLLPGISGSFILLILRKYDIILNAIGHFQFSILIPFSLGAMMGLIVFSRFINWLLNRFYQATLLTIIGILIGSLWIIWPFQTREYINIHEKERLISSTPFFPSSWNETIIYSLLMGILGLGLVLAMFIWSKKNNKQCQLRVKS